MLAFRVSLKGCMTFTLHNTISINFQGKVRKRNLVEICLITNGSPLRSDPRYPNPNADVKGLGRIIFSLSLTGSQRHLGAHPSANYDFCIGRYESYVKADIPTATENSDNRNQADAITFCSL